MTAPQQIVTTAGVLLVAALGWFFLHRPAATAAVEADGVQQVRVTVRGGYQPDVIQARTGVPLRIVMPLGMAGVWALVIWVAVLIVRGDGRDRTPDIPRAR